jgi:hypothetical protein
VEGSKGPSQNPYIDLGNQSPEICVSQAGKTTHFSFSRPGFEARTVLFASMHST